MLTVPKLPPYKGKDAQTAALWAASNAETSLADRFKAAGIANWNTSKAAHTVCNVLIMEYRDAQLDAGNSAASDDHQILQLALDGYADAGALSLINWKDVAAGVALTPLYPPAALIAATGAAKWAYYKKLNGTIQQQMGISGTLPDALKRMAAVDPEAAALIAVEAGENVKGVASDVYTDQLIKTAQIPIEIAKKVVDAALAAGEGLGDLLFWIGAAAAAGLGYGLYKRARGK